jgi:putative holliday junction resolvase
MRLGIRLGVDVGEVRVGVARCDPQGTLAVPVETVRRDQARQADLKQLASFCEEYEAVEVVVGLPLGLSGREGPAAAKARAYATALAGTVAPVPVRLVDERLSTVSAQQAYRLRGVSEKKSRSRIDAAAAAVILQSALDSERATGKPPGELIRPTDGDETKEHR